MPEQSAHDDRDARSHPILCDECRTPMDSPVCCANCGALNPLPPSMFTYFELFGIACSYDVDPQLLRRKYLALSRSVHPDVAGRSSEEVHRRSLELSAGLNRAYDTLRDPVARAEYLLALAGGPRAGEDKTAPAGLLAEVMDLREEIEEATNTKDQARLTAVQARLLDRQRRSIETIGRICREQDLKDPDVQKELRQQLNAGKYWIGLLDKLPTNTDIAT